MQEAQDLCSQNDSLPPENKLSMRGIAKKVGIGKTTVIERLSGRYKGTGHIAGGARKLRIMIKGMQAGHQVGHFNNFNRIFNQIIKWVIKQVSCLVVCTADCLMTQPSCPHHK